MTEVSEITITASGHGQLGGLVDDLLREQLCASAHIDQIETRYQLSGRIGRRTEYRAIIHTRTTLVPVIIEAARTILITTIMDPSNRQYPYEIPCVTVTPIKTGNPDYLTWVLDESRNP